jgi:type IV pilus assembly protein PilA
MTCTRANQRGSKRRTQSSGFTLVELMATIMIVAVLGALATYSVRKYIMTSKTAEATQMIGTIKAAQEQYRADTFSYRDVSGVGSLSDYSTFYPATQIGGQKKYAWGGGTDAVAMAWRELGVTTNSPVYYTYGCAAGSASTAPASAGLPGGIADYPTAALGVPWYMVKAAADFDGDQRSGYWVGVSFTGQIFHAHDPAKPGGPTDATEE